MSARTGHRKRIASAAEGVLAGTVPFRRFVELIEDADHDDPLLEDLIAEIQHMPKRGGFLGMNPREHDQWLAATRELIRRAAGE